MNEQVIIVCGVVVKGGKILMLQRNEPELKNAHLKWEFPGGKIEFNELPEEALKREIFEEAGVEATIDRMLPHVVTSYWNYDWGKRKAICLIYLCNYVSEEEVAKDHRVERIDWFKKEEISGLDSLPGTNEIIKLVFPL